MMTLCDNRKNMIKTKVETSCNNYAVRYLSSYLQAKVTQTMEGENTEVKQKVIELFLQMSEIEKQIIELINT